MIKGISLGIGLAIGIIFTIVLILILIVGIMALYSYSLQRKFTVELFMQYYKKLLRQERFEESDKVNKIITQLKKKEQPKELLQDYKVDVNSYLYWQPTRGGGDRLIFKHDRRIIRKKRKRKS